MNEPDAQPVPNPIPQSLVITTVHKESDVPQIIYGLSIRGVRAKAVYNEHKEGDRFQIVHDSPNPSPIHIQIAKDSVDGIWDAILEEYPRAVTMNAHCYFCQYDVSTLPLPVTCPECGIELDTLKARRAMRDKRKP